MSCRVLVDTSVFFFFFFCVHLLSVVPLRWILVQPAHLDDSSELMAVLFDDRRPFAYVRQVDTALQVTEAAIWP